MLLTTSLIHALPLHDRRVFNRYEAASYVGVSPGHFAKLVREGVMPASLPSYGRVRRWDKASIDRALDVSIGATRATSDRPNAYEQWKAKNGQG